MIDVLHITPSLFGPAGLWGGGERYPLELARAQSELVRTTLVSVGRPPSSWREGRLDVRILPLRHRWRDHELNGLSEQLLWMIARSRVIHLHQYNTALSSCCLMAAAILRKPAFVTDHGGSGPSLNRKYRLHKLVRQNLSVSHHAVSFFPELTDRSSVIYGGVDTHRFRPPATAGRRPRSVVFVGRMIPSKGIDVLIRAVDSTTPLDLYGRAYDPVYRRHLGHLAEGKQVAFHHDASDEDVVQALQRARVAVLPSVYRTYDGGHAPNTEYFGLALAEAMACGTPVVGSMVGGIPEVVDDGVTGRLVPGGDTGALATGIRDLLDAEDATWERMSRACLHRVEARFTWRRVAERCLGLYGLDGRRDGIHGAPAR